MSTIRTKLARVAPLGALALALGGGFAADAATPTNVLFIVDSSGSMKAKAERQETRMTIAKRALAGAFRHVPRDWRLGMVVYGHRNRKDCRDIELTDPVGASNADQLARRVAGLEPKGETPIAAALEYAARSFAALKGQNNAIVLITDGIEECGGDPCAAARALKAAGLNLKVHVVGMNLTERQRASIECVVKETGGEYFSARNAAGLVTALQAAQAKIGPPAPPPPPPTPERFNLLAKKNGGELILSPGEPWSQIADDKLNQVYWFKRGGEAIFAFKDGRSGKFKSVAIYLPGAEVNYPKEVEILAGDEGVGGPFRSLGVVTLVNGKVRDGWQEFALPETTAKYVKIRLVSSQNGGADMQFFEIRLYGELADAATQGPAPAPAKERVNLLSPKQGGKMISSPGEPWPQIADDRQNQAYWFKRGGEAIFAFKDGRPGKLKSVAIYLPGAEANYPKQVEILAGDEGAGGPFRSLGVVTLVNGKVRDGWQEFSLPETTAKYVKIRLVSSQNNGPDMQFFEVRLYGELA